MFVLEEDRRVCLKDGGGFRDCVDGVSSVDCLN